MIYNKLPQLQKTLAIALALIGASGSLPLPSFATPLQTQSDLSLARAATLEQVTQPSFLRLQLAQELGQQRSRSLSNVLQTLPLLTDRGELAADSLTDRGAPRKRVEGASHFQTLPLLQDRGAPAPGKRIGGATRGMCPSTRKPLTALVPVTPVLSSDSVLGLTFADHPTFWFYFPFSLSAARPIEFILQDEAGKEVYSTFLSEKGTAPGVVGFKLPDTAPPLNINKRYKWSLTMYCDANERSDSRFVSGWVQRVVPDSSLRQQLEQGTPQQKLLLYTEVGVWHEAITTVAELRRQNPQDATLKQEWEQLLQAVGLQAIAAEPITSMLTPKK